MRTTIDANGPLKRSNEQMKSGSSERKSRDYGNDRFYNEDKYKIDRRAENSRDHREKRDRDSRSNRDVRDEKDEKSHDNSQKYDYKKLDDQKRYREQKRDYKRDSSDYYRDDKRYNRYDERKASYATNNKDRFNNLKTRYDDRRLYEDRSNDEKRTTNEERRSGGGAGGGTYSDDRRKELNERRNYNKDDDRKTDRRSDDRRTQRSYNDDRLNSYRARRSSSPVPTTHHSKSNNKYCERREDSNTRRERKRHSRSRTRSRSQSIDRPIESNLSSPKVVNQGTAPAVHLGDIKRQEVEPKILEKKNLPTARNFEALLTLPLSENASKQPNVVTVPVTNVASGTNITPATVQLPSYYNPNAINPNKYVEQMQKRKLIWGAKKSEDSASKWGHAQFSQDQDGKVASKFMRLMGIKNATGPGSEISTPVNECEKKSPPSSTSQNNTDVKTREAMFCTMEQQYEVARQVTHTMRGVGLGFSSQSRPY